MKKVNGVVKKYSREYSRTLKDGSRKKYKTEQVQITIPKQENIFENKEEVAILPIDEFKTIDDQEEIIASLELCNSILINKNNELKSKINSNSGFDKSSENRYSDLAIGESKSIVANSTESNLIEELTKKDALILELKEELAGLNETIEDLEDMTFKQSGDSNAIKSYFSDEDFLNLQKSYIELSKKYELLQAELSNEKISSLYHEGLANKFKEFILKID